MHDEDSGSTPVDHLVVPPGAGGAHGDGPPEPLGAKSPKDDLDDLEIDLPEDFDLVPAVRSFAVHAQPSTRPPPPLPASASRAPAALAPSPSAAPPPVARAPRMESSAPKPPRPAPPSDVFTAPFGPRDEATREIARPTADELRARIEAQRASARTSWGKSAVWIVVSAIVGGLVTFLAVRAKTRPAEEVAASTATAPVVGAAAAFTPPATSAAPIATAAPPATFSAPPATAPPAVPLGPTSSVAAAGAGTPSSAASHAVHAPPPPPAAPRIELLAAARAAQKDGKPARAKAVYQAILAKDGDDFDALTGLGDLAHAEGKYSDARAFYAHALAVNPSHRPALLGLADTLWDLDDKEGARARYRDLLKQAPPSSFPPRVGSRAAL